MIRQLPRFELSLLNWLLPDVAGVWGEEAKFPRGSSLIFLLFPGNPEHINPQPLLEPLSDITTNYANRHDDFQSQEEPFNHGYTPATYQTLETQTQQV